jgi:DNA-binding HxlR family transcriptional regulator
MIRGAWTLPVLRTLAVGASRTGDLLHELEDRQAAADGLDLSKKARHDRRESLDETLDRLADHGLIGLERVPGPPPDVHCWLTDAGLRTLTEIEKLD